MFSPKFGVGLYSRRTSQCTALTKSNTRCMSSTDGEVFCASHRKQRRKGHEIITFDQAIPQSVEIKEDIGEVDVFSLHQWLDGVCSQCGVSAAAADPMCDQFIERSCLRCNKHFAGRRFVRLCRSCRSIATAASSALDVVFEAI